MLKKLRPTIGIIDSGIGGISILNALKAKFKGGNYIYFADNLNMPYGNKFLKNRVNNLINYLKTNYLTDYIFIACNTASSVLKLADADVIKMQFDTNYTYLVTPLTKQTLQNINVVADKTLAKLIEKHIFNTKALNRIIKYHVNLHKLNAMDCFVLGCTHYELVYDLFKKYCPNSKIIKNSDFILKDFNMNFETNETSILFLQSKSSKSYIQKLKSLVED